MEIAHIVFLKAMSGSGIALHSATAFIPAPGQAGKFHDGFQNLDDG